MISLQPRRVLEIDWGELFGALRRGIKSHPLEPESAQIAFSVRTALDLLFEALRYPPGSEILVSAITIPDVLRILEWHSLIPVAVDINPETLEPRLDQAEKLINSRTRAFLACPLFGSRMNIEELSAFARERGLLLIEDLAQGYGAKLRSSEDAADVTLFSFAPIKTMTALGGALLRIRDPELRSRFQELEAALAQRSNAWFLRRTLKFAALKLFCRPACFGVLVRIAKMCGVNHDQFVARAFRSFSAGELRAQIRWRPSAVQRALLMRRRENARFGAVERRRELGLTLLELLRESVFVPGRANPSHTFWAFPVCVRSPDKLVELLYAHGFDSTRGAGNFCLACPQLAQSLPHCPGASWLLEHAVYLPVRPEVDLDSLSRVLQEHAVNTEGALHSPQPAP